MAVGGAAENEDTVAGLFGELMKAIPEGSAVQVVGFGIYVEFIGFIDDDESVAIGVEGLGEGIEVVISCEVEGIAAVVIIVIVGVMTTAKEGVVDVMLVELREGEFIEGVLPGEPERGDGAVGWGDGATCGAGGDGSSESGFADALGAIEEDESGGGEDAGNEGVLGSRCRHFPDG